MDDRGEVPACPQIHMLHGINAIPIHVRKGHPEFVHLRQRFEGRRRLKLIHIAGPELDVFQVKEIPFKKFR